jgi:hypothetical protein
MAGRDPGGSPTGPEGPPLDFARLSRGAYLVDVYAEADDAYKQFQETRRPSSLIESAAILCLGLTHLVNDEDGVWSGFRGLPKVLASDRDEVWRALENLERLVELEVRVLSQHSSGKTVESLEELLWEAGRAVLEYRDWPDRVERLHNVAEAARMSACKRASLSRKRDDGHGMIKRALRVAGGVGVVGANAAAAVSGVLPWPEAAASVLTGIEVAAPAIRD